MNDNKQQQQRQQQEQEQEQEQEQGLPPPLSRQSQIYSNVTGPPMPPGYNPGNVIYSEQRPGSISLFNPLYLNSANVPTGGSVGSGNPRYSIDSSMQAFLNIAGGDPVNQATLPAGGSYGNNSVSQLPDLNQIGRGFSIVNTLWPPSSSSAAAAGAATQPYLVQLNRQSDQLNNNATRNSTVQYLVARPEPQTSSKNFVYHNNNLELPFKKRLDDTLTSSSAPPPQVEPDALFANNANIFAPYAKESSKITKKNSMQKKSHSVKPASLNYNDITTVVPRDVTTPPQTRRTISSTLSFPTRNGESKRPVLGATKIDQLMLMIQARQKGITEKVQTTDDGELVISENSHILPSPIELVGGVEKLRSTTEYKKKHECPYCHKLFSQSTHLEVHIRSHTDYKPYQCSYCGKRFTQGGNLKTHQRLHTGERPYTCEICQKSFSRKGNLTAHKKTHQHVKPYICRLDNCNKAFTQLGNMKAHQNKFHLEALHLLTQRLATMDPNEKISSEERDLLLYFASLYKNSNKGIKGRGRDFGLTVSPEIHTTPSASFPNTDDGANSLLQGNSIPRSSTAETTTLTNPAYLSVPNTAPATAMATDFEFTQEQQPEPGGNSKVLIDGNDDQNSKLEQPVQFKSMLYHE